MLAVCCRAYHAALYILDAIQRLVARTPTTYEDVTPPQPSTTEEKLKSVLSAWFAKGETSDSTRKQNYPSWLYPSGTDPGTLTHSVVLRFILNSRVISILSKFSIIWNQNIHYLWGK